MGLDYSFKLYFNKEQLWNVLQGVVNMAVHHHPPTKIHFPDMDILIPLDSWSGKEKGFKFDDPNISFSTVLYFEEDEPITDYLSLLKNQDAFRGPPATDNNIVSIGYIYLDIHQIIPENFDSGLVLFDFGTPGTKMSWLFFESSSIRRKFLWFAEKYGALCGLLNREESGDVFWINNQSVDFEIDDPFMSPEEISIIHKSLN